MTTGDTDPKLETEMAVVSATTAESEPTTETVRSDVMTRQRTSTSGPVEYVEEFDEAK